MPGNDPRSAARPARATTFVVALPRAPSPASLPVTAPRSPAGRPLIPSHLHPARIAPAPRGLRSFRRPCGRGLFSSGCWCWSIVGADRILGAARPAARGQWRARSGAQRRARHGDARPGRLSRRLRAPPGVVAQNPEVRAAAQQALGRRPGRPRSRRSARALAPYLGRRPADRLRAHRLARRRARVRRRPRAGGRAAGRRPCRRWRPAPTGSGRPSGCRSAMPKATSG